jgi:CHAD domain-containing protein
MTKKPKKSEPLDADESVSEAFKIILKHNLRYLDEWESTARSWEDIEGVHQIRVAFRRMRSALQVFRSVVPPEVSQEWAGEMRWLASQFGPARDLDVFLDEGLNAVAGKLPLPGEEKMLALARRHREAVYGNVVNVLDSERYARFKQDFAAWLDSAAWRHGPLTAKQLKRLDGKIVPFARKLLDKQERLVLEAGTDVDRDVAEEMHQLRIQCKKLRYAAEFFTPLFDGMENFIGHMKGLQDLLGIMNDVAVMQHLLEDLLADTRDPEVLQYAGGLVGWRTRQYHEIKDSFDERWEELLNAKHPWWKR